MKLYLGLQKIDSVCFGLSCKKGGLWLSLHLCHLLESVIFLILGDRKLQRERTEGLISLSWGNWGDGGTWGGGVWVQSDGSGKVGILSGAGGARYPPERWASFKGDHLKWCFFFLVPQVLNYKTHYKGGILVMDHESLTRGTLNPLSHPVAINMQLRDGIIETRLQVVFLHSPTYMKSRNCYSRT